MISHLSNRSQPVVWKPFSLTLFYDSGFEIFSTSCLIPLDARLYLCFWSKLLIMYPGPSLWWGDIINQIFQKLQISDKAVCLEKSQSRKPSRKHNRWSQAPTSNILSNWCMLLQKKLFSLLSELTRHICSDGDMHSHHLTISAQGKEQCKGLWRLSVHHQE